MNIPKFKLPKLHVRLPHVRLPHFRLPPVKHVVIFLRLVAVAAILFVVFLEFSISAKNNNIALETQKIAQQDSIIAAQTKTIAENTQKIASQAAQQSQENQAHIDCIAQVFARYTRDDLPITINDINSCAVTEMQSTATGSASPSTTPSTTSTNKNGNSNNSQNSNSTPAPVKKNFVQALAGAVNSFIKKL